ncbi:MAG TPA: hypothetical protein VEQ11_03745 [Chloroflexota bacterium]|nr:hypothetical protein [Chloroflexota bacterium]
MRLNGDLRQAGARRVCPLLGATLAAAALALNTACSGTYPPVATPLPTPATRGNPITPSPVASPSPSPGPVAQ